MCHFASFQSLPRGWAEEQLLPIWETWFDPLLHFMRSTSTQMSINTICVWKWKRGPWRFEAKKFLYSIWRKEKVAFFVSTLLSISLGYNFTNKPAQLASYHYVLEQMQRLTSAGSSDFSFDTWLTGGKKKIFKIIFLLSIDLDFLFKSALSFLQVSSSYHLTSQQKWLKTIKLALMPIVIAALLFYQDLFQMVVPQIST